jgi:predicted DNA-binding transcriptional regulator AlpA
MDTPYLGEKAFSERYHISQRTVQRWRSTGDGPPFVRVGPRRVVYRLPDCEAWAAAQTHKHRAAELAHTVTR